jgi:hypothetical protein
MIRQERRRTPRGNSTVPLDLYDSKGQVIIGEGRFVNISLTGSMLESRQSLPVRHSIRLQVQAPSKMPLEFVGRVIWRKKKAAAFNYGIRFQPLSTSNAFAHHVTATSSPAAAFSNPHH